MTAGSRFCCFSFAVEFDHSILYIEDGVVAHEPGSIDRALSRVVLQSVIRSSIQKDFYRSMVSFKAAK